MHAEVLMSRRVSALALVILGGIWCLTASPAASFDRFEAQSPAAAPAPARAPLSDAEIEQFLLKGDVIRTKSVKKGTTGTTRVTMTVGAFTHDGQIQTIDDSKREFRTDRGVEFNFRDSWMFNVAAYKIDRLIGLNLVPPSVARTYKGRRGAFTWWIDDIKMDEADRFKEKLTPPDLDKWNQQMQLVRLFDQLIANVDRNLTNLLIGNDWNVWAIDHTRAFRTHTNLKTPGNIGRCDRQVFAKLKQLDKTSIKEAVGEQLQTYEIDALLKRRDLIVAIIEQKGDAGLFDRKQ
jgi:hypothetical protein